VSSPSDRGRKTVLPFHSISNPVLSNMDVRWLSPDSRMGILENVDKEVLAFDGIEPFLENGNHERDTDSESEIQASNSFYS